MAEGPTGSRESEEESGGGLNAGGGPAGSKGFWTSLLSSLGLGGGTGAAAAGTVAEGGALGGGGLGAGIGSGLLATKAGLIGVIAAGTAIAGGVGVATYKMFGPQSLGTVSGYSSLFQPKPKNQAAAPGAAGPSGNGGGASQRSLAEFREANAAQKTAATPAAMPAGYAAPGAQAGAASAGSLSNLTAANASFIPSLPGGAKPIGNAGAPQNSMAPGGSGAAAAPSGQGTGAAAQSVVGSQGGAMSPAAAGVNGGLRAFGATGGNGGGGGAYGQAQHEFAENAGATSSQGAGQTYDNGGRSGGNSLGGTGTGAAGVSGTGPSGISNPTYSNSNPWRGGESSVPPTSGATGASPWQTAIELATGLTVGALALLFLARRMALKAIAAGPEAEAAAQMTVRVLLGIAIAMGLAVVYLGARMGMGPYSQTLQGVLFIMSGAAIATSAAASMLYPKGIGAIAIAGMISAAVFTGLALFTPESSTCPPSGSCPDLFGSSGNQNPSAISNLGL